MSKVVCDICGTTYPDTADCCPICGCSRGLAAELSRDGGAAPTPAKKKEIFDFDEVNTTSTRLDEPEYAYDYDEMEEDEEPGRHNTALVIALTVLIVALVVMTVFLFLRYFLPGKAQEETQAPSTQAQTLATTAPTETTELVIPCQSLALSSGNAELTMEGQLFLLNVVITPADTTDLCTYESGDESVATVDGSGRITAVGEGETTVTITCGSQSVVCPVICTFAQETTAATEVETTAETVNTSIELKLKKTDIMLPVYTYFTLELDCDLAQTDVTWTSASPYTATVDESGVVTAMRAGTTEITAKYGDQEVKCIVRCY